VPNSKVTSFHRNLAVWERAEPASVSHPNKRMRVLEMPMCAKSMDGRPWSQCDLGDLKYSIQQDASLATMAAFLCRNETLDANLNDGSSEIFAEADAHEVTFTIQFRAAMRPWSMSRRRATDTKDTRERAGDVSWNGRL
jgi:hypothetical protein